MAPLCTSIYMHMHTDVAVDQLVEGQGLLPLLELLVELHGQVQHGAPHRVATNVSGCVDM